MPKLTTILIKTLWKTGPPIPGKPKSYSDGEGLYFRVTGIRAASWVLRYQLDGKRPEMGLGAYPGVQLAEARDKARQHLRLARVEKVDPLTHRRSERSRRQTLTERQQVTFKQLVAQYDKEKPWGESKWHRRQFLYAAKNHILPVIGDLLVRDIDRILIRRVLDPIWDTKEAMAGQVQKHLAQLIDFADYYHYRQDDPRALPPANPARGVQKHMAKHKKSERRKALPYEEIPEFMRALRTFHKVSGGHRANIDRAAIVAAHATGTPMNRIALVHGLPYTTVVNICRVGKIEYLDYGLVRARVLEAVILAGPLRINELLSAEWREVNWGQQIITIPRKRMKIKEGDDFIVPLSTRLVAIFEEMYAIRDGDFIFPGTLDGRSSKARLTFAAEHPGAKGVHADYHAVYRLLRRDLGRTDVDIHGFRRSFKNWATASGQFRDIAIEFCLDHTYGTEMERTYRDVQLVEERRVVLQSWSDYCTNPPAEVIQLPIHRRVSA